MPARLPSVLSLPLDRTNSATSQRLTTSNHPSPKTFNALFAGRCPWGYRVRWDGLGCMPAGPGLLGPALFQCVAPPPTSGPPSSPSIFFTIFFNISQSPFRSLGLISFLHLLPADCPGWPHPLRATTYFPPLSTFCFGFAARDPY
jgi:hypothetical protein